MMHFDRALERETLRRLCCPVCRSALNFTEDHINCVNPRCKSVFPIIDGIPILINESASLFSIQDIMEDYSKPKNSSKLDEFLKRLLPSIDLNVKAKENYAKLAELVVAQNFFPSILILGGRQIGKGMEPILSLQDVEIMSTDVYIGPYTTLGVDAHDIPFEDETFDLVIIQAVLEHVVDPYRCVEEIHRVLKPMSLVYAETAFMSQVHMGRYDFTRFTHLGHRRLFRQFTEVSSGSVCGPGIALAWSLRYFLRSFFDSKSQVRSIVLALATISSFWLKYFDPFLIDKPSTLDAALGYYFMGSKSDQTLSDKELILLFRGFDLDS